jgi:hypothetical protein
MRTRLRHLPKIAVIASLLAGPSALTADTVKVAYASPASIRPVGLTTPPLVRSPVAPPVILGSAPRALTVPDLAVIVPGGATASQLSAIAGLHGVRAVLAVDGGQVRVNGRIASVLGVPMQAFRAWTPPVTAAADGVWTVLAAGNLVAASGTVTSLGLRLGTSYPVAGTASVQLPVMATAPLGIPGVDAIVSTQRGAQLGLSRNVAVLVSAPGTGYAALVAQIQKLAGPRATVISLVPVVQAAKLPVITTVRSDLPRNYLQLYQDSAAAYCPGLSWTVLAAIGEIESGDGANDGPSTAGALGPMQFMPGTWAEWGTDGFGQAGAPDIMNPLDAVPSAARMLCADGARDGTAGLSGAIYDYNHATWYVSEVLDLATEYAQEYPSSMKG